ncbi:hypothetical protein GCM10028862_22420 [Luteimonas pelagia]
MRAVEKRYVREFIPAMALYAVIVFACGWALKGPLAGAEPLVRGLVSVLPLAPIALVLRAIVRVIRDSDELQRRIDLEAIAVATLVVGTGYFTLGLMDAAGVIEVPGEVALLWALPLLSLTYGISKLVATRRYR